MKVKLKETSIQLISESSQDRVYLKSFMGKNIDISYVDDSDGDEGILNMNIEIFSGEKGED